MGQGSAAILDTHQHRLVVDLGASYEPGAVLARDVLRPTLRISGPDRADYVLITHYDNDHAGGLNYFLQAYPDVEELSPDGRCPTEPLVLDAVKFDFYQARLLDDANNRSCTMLVSSRSSRRVYFSGDIERSAELMLHRRLPPVDVLVAPHHGSNTSSSAFFLDRLSPRAVIISAGYQNRYGHPHPAVLQRYRQRNISYAITADDGTLTWSSEDGEIASYRWRGLGFVWR